jgi:hypothetical protein
VSARHATAAARAARRGRVACASAGTAPPRVTTRAYLGPVRVAHSSRVHAQTVSAVLPIIAVRAGSGACKCREHAPSYDGPTPRVGFGCACVARPVSRCGGVMRACVMGPCCGTQNKHPPRCGAGAVGAGHVVITRPTRALPVLAGGLCGRQQFSGHSLQEPTLLSSGF